MAGEGSRRIRGMRIYYGKIEKGICTSCNEKAVPNKRRCQKHLNQNQRYGKIRHAKYKIRKVI